MALLSILIARSFDGLVDYGAHYRVKHSKNEFVNNHINGIENSKGYAKYRLAKFKGIENRISYFILKSVFCLQLLGSKVEFRYKTTQENLYQKLLKLIRENLLRFCWA